MKAALKQGDKERLSVIRMLLSDVKNIDLAPRPTTAEDAVAAYAKKLRKSQEEYQKIGKNAEVDKLKFELGVVEGYLPKKGQSGGDRAPRGRVPRPQHLHRKAGRAGDGRVPERARRTGGGVARQPVAAQEVGGEVGVLAGVLASARHGIPGTGRSNKWDFQKSAPRRPHSVCPRATRDTIDLKDLVAKQAVVLYFYPRADTPGCTKEACGFRDALGSMTARRSPSLGSAPTRSRRFGSSRTSTVSTFRCSPTRTIRWPTATGCGRKRACTAGNISASPARRS